MYGVRLISEHHLLHVTELMSCFQILCPISGVLTQGGGVFGTFVSSFYLQFSKDGRRWYTYNELVTDARPRAKVRSSTKTSVTVFLFCNSVLCCLLSRFFLVTMMIKVWQRSTWTEWCQHDLYACSLMTSRTAFTCDWRSWAAEMVITLFNSTLLTLLSAFILTCSHLHLGYQPWMTPNPLSSASPGGSCKENEFHCENGYGMHWALSVILSMTVDMDPMRDTAGRVQT